MKFVRISLVLFVLVGFSGLLASCQQSDHSRPGLSGNSSNQTVNHSKTTDENFGEKTDQPDQSEAASDGNGAQDYVTRSARVLEVYDGDSFKVRFHDNHATAKIRVKGIDCPESSDKVDKCHDPNDLIDIPCEQQVPLGIRAKSYALSVLGDEQVRLESYNNFKRDDYDRILAYVRLPNGEDYGLKTVKKGYCKDYGIRYDHPRGDQYERNRTPLRR